MAGARRDAAAERHNPCAHHADRPDHPADRNQSPARSVSPTVSDDSPSLEDRFVGCLLGHALGDALGAPFEGLPPEAIYYEFGPTGRLFERPPADELVYTDDTQMTIGVAECLLARGTIDTEELARRFHANYEPWRGYGPGTRKLLDATDRGTGLEVGGRGAVRRRVARQRGGDAGGAGGAAVPPRPGRVCDEARRSAELTHTHPIGIDGAVLIAAGVALALRGGPFDRRAFFEELGRCAETEEFRWQLRTAAR